MSKIVGIQKLDGVFEGHPYSNYRITCLENFNANAKDAYGHYSKQYSAKSGLLESWMRENKLVPSGLIGLECKFFFDDHGKVSLIQRA